MRGALQLAVVALSSALAVFAAAQTDHDNVDAGRPLRFEDAEPVAFRTLAFEYGLGLSAPRRRGLGLDGTFEFVYGASLNGQLEIGFSPVLGGRPGSRDTFGAIADYDVAYLYSLRQEIRNTPALAVKGEVSLPGLAGGEPRYRVRGIATKTVGQYDRVHLNLDADFVPKAIGDERRATLGAILGYTHPIGYPREFNTTGLAEVALVPGRRAGEGYGLSLGVGVRRQISPRAVLDFGLQSDVVPGRNAASTPLRLVAGYSVSF